MSELSRRGFIGSAAAAASMVGLNAAADEEFSFKNNVPDPLLAGDELPTFKFELEKSEGKEIGGSYGKEATVKQLPISKGIAGVSMKLEPGAMRAALARHGCRVGVCHRRPRAHDRDRSEGACRDQRFRARRHLVLPPRPRRTCSNVSGTSLLISSSSSTTATSRNSAHSASPTGSATPSKHLLAKNFGLPESAFEGFPKDEVYFAPRPGAARDGPAEPPRYREIREHQARPLTSPPDTHEYRMLAQEPHSIHKGGREWRVGADRFPISKTVTGVILDLEPGGLRGSTGIQPRTSGNT